MSSIVKKWGFYTVMIIVVICTIALAIFSNHAPKGNSDLEGTLDKIMQYLGIIAIPLVLSYFPQHEKLAKQQQEERERSFQEQQQEAEYHKQAEYLMGGIHLALISAHKYTVDYTFGFGSNIPIESVEALKNTIFHCCGRDYFKPHISKQFSEEKSRIDACKILARMNILHKEDNQYNFYIESLMEKYQTELDIRNLTTKQSFYDVLEIVIKEFSDDTHLKTVIAILKDMDE